MSEFDDDSPTIHNFTDAELMDMYHPFAYEEKRAKIDAEDERLMGHLSADEDRPTSNSNVRVFLLLFALMVLVLGSVYFLEIKPLFASQSQTPTIISRQAQATATPTQSVQPSPTPYVAVSPSAQTTAATAQTPITTVHATATTTQPTPAGDSTLVTQSFTYINTLRPTCPFGEDPTLTLAAEKFSQALADQGTVGLTAKGLGWYDTILQSNPLYENTVQNTGYLATTGTNLPKVASDNVFSQRASNKDQVMADCHFSLIGIGHATPQTAGKTGDFWVFFIAAPK